MNPVLRRKLTSTAVIVGLFVLWEFLCAAFDVSDVVLPRPSQIVTTLVLRFPALWPHTLQTLYTTLVGFALGVAIGVMIGIGIGWSKIAYDVAYPLLVGFSSIPKVAVVPIFVLYWGAGTIPALLTAMIMSVFPVVVNVATGLATTEPELEDVMKTLRATRFDTLWNVGLPHAMPYFFASLKVAVTLAFVGSVISETVASNRGIGNMMMIASAAFDVPLVYAGLLILAILGVALYGIFSLIEARVTGWAHRRTDFANDVTGQPGVFDEISVSRGRGDGCRPDDVRFGGRAGGHQNTLHPGLEDPGPPRLVLLGAGQGIFRRREARRHHRPGRGLGRDGDAGHFGRL
jgi:NitT/TauT family transport system permease protein